MELKLSEYNINVPLENQILLYNSRTNNLAVFEREKYMEMVMALKNKVENENIKRLIPLGFIVDAGRKELEEVLHSFERSKYLSDALSLSIAVTNKCNLGCKFCYLRKAAPVSLSGDVATGIYNFADKMCQDRGYSKLFVTWSGGEPTIELPSIRKMTGHFCSIAKVMEWPTRLIW